jgi:hypothetical protein
MSIIIGRREMIFALGSASVWPLAALAEQSGRMLRVGVLMGRPPLSWLLRRAGLAHVVTGT